MTKKHLLFVDDDGEFLSLLQQSLSIVEPGWAVSCAGSGREALEHLEKTTFDAVVADYQMPEMDGAQLLEKVQELRPGTMRFLLSGYLNQDDVIRLALPVHQCFLKPLDVDRFRRTIRRITALRDLLSNDVLKRLIAQCGQVPTIPTLYLELAKELKSPDSSLERVEAVIRKDPAIAAKILQLVNSSFFGLSRKIETLGEAINYVGVQIIKALVLTLPVFSRFEGVKVQDYSPSAIWDHSWRTAVLARRISQEEGQGSLACEEAFLAGLLHDLGKIILAANLSALCREATSLGLKKRIPMHLAEREVFGCTHAMVAAYLLGLWGIEEPIVEAVAFHNEPMESPSSFFNSLTAVHVANALDHSFANGKPEDFQNQVDIEYLMSLGLTARLDAWKKAGLLAFQATKQASGE